MDTPTAQRQPSKSSPDSSSTRNSSNDSAEAEAQQISPIQPTAETQAPTATQRATQTTIQERPRELFLPKSKEVVHKDDSGDGKPVDRPLGCLRSMVGYER